MPEAYIIDAARTPRGVGKVGKGALADLHPQHLGATVLKALRVVMTSRLMKSMTLSGVPRLSVANRALTLAVCLRCSRIMM